VSVGSPGSGVGVLVAVGGDTASVGVLVGVTPSVGVGGCSTSLLTRTLTAREVTDEPPLEAVALFVMRVASGTPDLTCTTITTLDGDELDTESEQLTVWPVEHEPLSAVALTTFRSSSISSVSETFKSLELVDLTEIL
jgi:hypothetical protein